MTWSLRLAITLALAHVSTAVHAEPIPVLLPPATPGTDLRVSSLLAADGLHGQAAALALEGRLATKAHVEGYARASILLGHAPGGKDSEFAAPGFADAAAALKLGGRARVPSEHLIAIASVWTSLVPVGLPMSPNNGFADRPDAFDALVGLPDPYAVREGVAVGGALDIGYRVRCGFAQLEIGTAIVDDARYGIAVDDLMIAASVGGYVTERMTLALEYRLVQEPTGALSSGATLHHVALALGNLDQTRRLRLGVGEGAAFGFDLARRF